MTTFTVDKLDKYHDGWEFTVSRNGRHKSFRTGQDGKGLSAWKAMNSWFMESGQAEMDYLDMQDTPDFWLPSTESAARQMIENIFITPRFWGEDIFVDSGRYPASYIKSDPKNAVISEMLHDEDLKTYGGLNRGWSMETYRRIAENYGSEIPFAIACLFVLKQGKIDLDAVDLEQMRAKVQYRTEFHRLMQLSPEMIRQELGLV